MLWLISQIPMTLSKTAHSCQHFCFETRRCPSECNTAWSRKSRATLVVRVGFWQSGFSADFVAVHLPRESWREIHTHTYTYGVVFNFGVFFLFKGSKMLPFFCFLMQPFWNKKKSVFPRWNLFIRCKVSLEIPTSSLSSNAFKSGALMLRNIGTPLSNASTHPIFECINFPCFWPFVLLSSQPRKPIL